MGTRKSRFIVVDQSLKGFGGHHFEVSVAVAGAVAEAGYEPWILSHVGYEGSVPKGLNWQKVFRQAWTESTRIHLPAILFWDLVKWLPGTTQLFSLKKESFGFQLQKAIKEFEISAQDHLFIHTLNFVQLLEVLFLSSSLAESPSFHLVLRQDPGERGRLGVKQIVLKKIFQMAKAGNKLFFYSDTKGLCSAYQSLSNLEFRCLPVLYDQSIVLPASKTPAEVFAVTYLGDGRREKGFQYLPSIVETTIKGSSHVHFYLQSFLAQAASTDSELVQTQKDLRALQQKYPKQVRLFEKPLSPQEYLQLLCDSNLVLLPYEAEAYRLRSSGILSQAIGAKKIAVVPEKTSLAEAFPMAVGATYKSVNEIPEIILGFAKQKEKLAPALAKASEDWLKAHSNSSLVEALQLEEPKR